MNSAIKEENWCCSVAPYGWETLTIKKSDANTLEAFEVWICRQMENILWTDKMSNEKLATKEKIGEDRCIMQTISKRERAREYVDHITKSKKAKHTSIQIKHKETCATNNEILIILNYNFKIYLILIHFWSIATWNSLF